MHYFGSVGGECIQHTVWRSDTEYAILCRMIKVTICDKETIDVCVICLYGHLGSGVTGKKDIELMDAYAR